MSEEFNGTQTEIFSRVVGYIRPTKGWNEGKQAEFDQRENFDVGKFC